MIACTLRSRDESDGRFVNIGRIVVNAPAKSDLYCCGPVGMLTAFEKATAEIPTERVHVEYFLPIPPPIRMLAGALSLDSRAKCYRALREPDLHVFAKLFEDCLKRSFEAQAFSGREIGGDDNVLDFLVGHFVDVDLTRQPAS